MDDAVGNDCITINKNNGDGTFSPVVIDIAKEKMHCYDPIKAEA